LKLALAMISELRSSLLCGVDELERVAAGTLILVRGARGGGVQAAQRGLLALGYGLLGGADGVFGASTEAALRGFRELHGLVSAAVLDASTLARLDGSLVRAEAVAEHVLVNPRFAGDVRLGWVLRGQGPLPRRGEVVQRVQQALLDLQFALPRWGVDGVFGAETAGALRRFQAWQRIRPGGELTPLTMMALDQLAPASGTRVARSPEYERMIRDGLLTVTVAVGHDEDGDDLREFPELQAGLRDDGFLQVGADGDDAVQTFMRPLMIPGRVGTMRVRLVSRSTRDPELRFADGLVQDSVCIYAGHARHGVGLDGEDGDSVAEHFGIGVGAPERCDRVTGHDVVARELLAGVPNDMLTSRFDPQRYQLWAFAGCTTRYYLDELRRLIAAKRPENLDLVVSTRPIYWVDSAFYPLEIVRGLLRGRTINEITAALSAQAVATERIFGVVESGSAFFADGFGDNAAG